jgi:cell division protease FtsH
MFGRRFLLFVLLLLVLNTASVALFGPSGTTRIRIPYSPTFLSQVTAGNVSSISSQGSVIQGIFRHAVNYPPGSTNSTSTLFNTDVPDFADKVALEHLLESKGVTVNASPPSSGPSTFVNILLSFGPTLLFIGLLVLLFRRAGGAGMSGLAAFGRSGARRADPAAQHVTFADVAGIEEAKSELSEIVDFLRNPERYQRLGGRIPRGVLLSGAPGTGKTLLAKAVAGEANVPFFSISASEFVEAIVGVGASRVRDLFKQAKEASPAIIFIDELDAIGRQRGSALVTGANDEREQTLNQILTEMDGFESNTAVIVLAATNRPEVLDPALLRPGRFDRRVTVPPPDKDGRRKILEVHTRSLTLAPDVDLGRLAASTPGMVGADLANLANEAALMAARRNHDTVEMADFTDALEKILLGTPRGIVLTPEDRRRTAYHESGHAIVGMLTPGADPVRKVSIIPRGMALGVTLSAPEADRVSYDEEALQAKIRVALGGRAAEEVVFERITTGAESDIQQVTQIARQMVGRWGMSEAIGPIAVLPSEPQGILLPGTSETSETTQRLIDEEVRRIVEEAHVKVRELLTQHRAQLDSLAQALLEAETLDQDAAYAAAGIAPPAESPAPVSVAAMKGSSGEPGAPKAPGAAAAPAAAPAPAAAAAPGAAGAATGPGAAGAAAGPGAA